MKRTHVFIPDPLTAKLAKLSQKTGLSVSELIRRAVESYLLGK